MKFCKDCKHAKEGGSTWMGMASFEYPWICKHPTELDVVAGLATTTCHAARASFAGCGLHGNLWEEGAPEPRQWFSVMPDPPTEAPRKWWRIFSKGTT